MGYGAVSTRLTLGVENERTGTERDIRNCLARLISHVRTETRKVHFLCSADRKQRIGSHTRLIPRLLKVMTTLAVSIPLSRRLT